MRKSVMVIAVVVAALIAVATARLASPLHSLKFSTRPSPYSSASTASMLKQHRFGTYVNITAADLYPKWVQVEDIVIVDVREVDEFEKAHIPSAHNHPLSTLEQTFKHLPSTSAAAVYIHCAGGVRSLKAIALLESLGYQTPMVNVQDGFNAWKGPTASGLFDEMTAATLLQLYSNHTASSLFIVDVREADEYHAGHIPGAINLPLSTIAPDQLPQDYPKIYIHCQGGVRSLKAIKKLLDAGYMAVMINITDGFNGWKGPVVVDSALKSYLAAFPKASLFEDYLAAFPKTSFEDYLAVFP